MWYTIWGKKSHTWYTEEEVEKGDPKSPWRNQGEDPKEKSMRQQLRQKFSGLARKNEGTPGRAISKWESKRAERTLNIQENSCSAKWLENEVSNRWEGLINQGKDSGMGPNHKESHKPWIRIWTLWRVGNNKEF